RLSYASSLLQSGKETSAKSGPTILLLNHHSGQVARCLARSRSTSVHGSRLGYRVRFLRRSSRWAQILLDTLTSASLSLCCEFKGLNLRDQGVLECHFVREDMYGV